MKETGKVISIEEGNAKILIKRNTACGNCGACQVGQEKLEMIMTAENRVNAEVGDEVEIDLETTDFLTAVLIGYGIPLVGLILGVVLGYNLSPLLGAGYNASQGIAGIAGLLFMAGAFFLIRKNEHKLQKLKKFHPTITGIVSQKENHG